MITTKNIGVYCRKDDFKKLVNKLEEDGFLVEKSIGRIKYDIQIENYVFKITVLEYERFSNLSDVKIATDYYDIKHYCESFVEEKVDRPEEPAMHAHIAARQQVGVAYEAQMNNYREIMADAAEERDNPYTEEEIANGDDALPI
jgi:hypothetical protein